MGDYSPSDNQPKLFNLATAALKEEGKVPGISLYSGVAGSIEMLDMSNTHYQEFVNARLRVSDELNTMTLEQIRALADRTDLCQTVAGTALATVKLIAAEGLTLGHYIDAHPSWDPCSQGNFHMEVRDMVAPLHPEIHRTVVGFSNNSDQSFTVPHEPKKP